MTRTAVATRAKANGSHRTPEELLAELAPAMTGQVEREEVEIKPIVVKTIAMTLVGTTPLLMDNGVPAQEQIENSKRSKTTGRAAREPVGDEAIEKKWLASRYLVDGRPGIQTRAIALAIADGHSAAIQNPTYAIPKSKYAFRAITVLGPELLPLEGVAVKDFRMLRTLGKNANRGAKADEGTTDVRYRAELPAGWRVTITVRFRADMLTLAQVIDATRSAGESIGIGAWRKQKGGTHGMFEVVVGKEVTVSGR